MPQFKAFPTVILTWIGDMIQLIMLKVLADTVKFEKQISCKANEGKKLLFTDDIRTEKPKTIHIKC